jgi:predicted DNA-binding ribbon-helix-helix protein
MGHLQEISLHLSPELVENLNSIAEHRRMTLNQLIVASLVTCAEECAFEASHSFAHRLHCIEERLSKLETARS